MDGSARGTEAEAQASATRGLEPDADCPPNAHLAPPPSNIHEDGYATDVSPHAGILGEGDLDVELFSAGTLVGGICTTFVYTRDGFMVTLSLSYGRSLLLMMDTERLEVISELEVPKRRLPPIWELADAKVRDKLFRDVSGGAYFFLDDLDRVVLAAADGDVWIIDTRDAEGRPGLSVHAKIPLLDLDTRPKSPLPPPSVDAFGHPYRWLALGKLKYLELVLGGADPSAPLPVVVLFHGLGDRPRLPDAPDPDEIPIRLIFPEAPFHFDAGFAWFPIRVRDDRPEAMAAALRQMGNELAELLDRLDARYKSPCKPIIGGFSQGGIVTWALAVEHPDAVSAAFPMSAWLPPELVERAASRARALPRLRMTHGDRDEVVPFENTRLIVEALAAEGAPIELTVAEGAGHRFTDEMKRALASWVEESVTRCLARDGHSNP